MSDPEDETIDSPIRVLRALPAETRGFGVIESGDPLSCIIVNSIQLPSIGHLIRGAAI